MIVLDDNPAQSFLFSEMSYLENLTFLLDRKLKKSILKQSYINSVRSEYYGEAGDVIDTKYIASLSLKEKYGLIYNKISLFHPKILVVKKPFAYGGYALPYLYFKTDAGTEGSRSIYSAFDRLSYRLRIYQTISGS